MVKRRNRYSPDVKVSILKRHLVDKVAVSDLCDQHGLSPTVFYRWQKQFFENGSISFTPKRKGKENRQDRRIRELEQSIEKVNREVKIRRKIQLQLLHSEKLSALGRLASSIAHEFGNPLIGIKYLLTDFIERPFLSKEDQKLLLLGMEECDRMTKLLKNLGQLNRPTTGEKSLENIHKIMDNILFFQAKLIKPQQLKIVKNYAPDLPDVFIIQDQISQVLLNLTINAADATSASEGTITVTTWRTAAKIFLSIADTGKGIDQNIQNNIFEPFFSTKKEEDGTGLGLSTSYGIIKQHRGQLTFISEPDKGTTFTLSLPLNQDPHRHL
ncbi:MAG: transposase [Deltaproteobacteria bacterium]|nr:transposase [Deltaproteobacteria bacterium]